MLLGYARVSTIDQNLDRQIDALVDAGVDNRKRTKEGLSSAWARGRKGDRHFKDKKDVELAFKMYDSMEYSTAEIAKATKISKTSIYRYIKNRKKSQ